MPRSAQALHRCLSPDAAARPTAAELRAVLSGRGKPATVPKPSAEGDRRPPRPQVRRAPPLAAEALVLQAPDGKSLRLSVRTELGKALMRQFGPDAEFWDHRQCVIERGARRPMDPRRRPARPPTRRWSMAAP